MQSKSPSNNPLSHTSEANMAPNIKSSISPNHAQRASRLNQMENNFASSLLVKKKNIVELNISCYRDSGKRNNNVRYSDTRKSHPNGVKLNNSILKSTALEPSTKQNEAVINKPWNMSAFFTPKTRNYFEMKTSAITKQSITPQKSFTPLLDKELGLNFYDIHQLSSLHKAVLMHSKGNLKLLKKAFIVVLNFKGIIIEQDKLYHTEQQFAKVCQFNNFVKLFFEVQSHYFKQSTIDYLNILFNRKPEQEIHVDEIFQIFRKRMQESTAKQLYDLVVEAIKTEINFYCQKIKLVQFYNICYRNYQICSKINQRFLNDKSMKKCR